ncbi:MAG: Gfo/Idh/MocA family oxidoreductase [Gemmataceae bacterium]
MAPGAAQALKADPNVRLVAMGDAFADKLRGSLANLRNDPSLAPKIDVPNERQFTGIDAYTKVIEQCDVVLLTSPPHFRPTHIEAAVRAGKHIFAEKPMAVDGPGVRRVLAAVEQAKQKKLALVAGFCWQHRGLRETVKQIGNVVAIQAPTTPRPLERRTPRAWATPNGRCVIGFVTWLSGDFNVEQHIHSLDKAMWIAETNRPSSVGYGDKSASIQIRPHLRSHGRDVRVRQRRPLLPSAASKDGCKNDVNIIMGTEPASLIRHQVTGNPWAYRPWSAMWTCTSRSTA